MKILLTVLLLPVVAVMSFARSSAQGYCEQGGHPVITNGATSTTKVQQSYPQCFVTVYYTGGGNGTVTTSGTSVTLVTGKLFGGWGNITININGVNYTVAFVSSPTTLTLTTSAGTHSSPVPYQTQSLAPAPIYSNASGTPLSNPFQADTFGHWQFFAANDTYNAIFSGGGIPTPFSYTSILLFDPADQPLPAAPVQFLASDYNFTPQLPGGTLIPGANTFNVSPGIPGVSGSDVGHNLYFSGGTGTPQECFISGGTALSGVAGTLTVTCPSGTSISGTWSFQSVLAGLQEAMNAACARGGGEIYFAPGTYTVLGQSNVPCNGIGILGTPATSNFTTVFSRTITAVESVISVVGKTEFTFQNIVMRQVINFNPSGGGTIINKPLGGSHINLYSCNTCLIEHSRFENMPINILVTGGAQITFRDVQWLGLYDQTKPSLQVTSASLFLAQDSMSGIPTYITIDNNQFYGYSNGNGSGKTNIGPFRMVWIQSVEDMFVGSGTSMGGANQSNMYIQGLTGPAQIIANIRMDGVKFDSAADEEVQFVTDGGLIAQDILITNCVFNGEGQSDRPLLISGAALGAHIFSNNTTRAFLVSSSFQHDIQYGEIPTLTGSTCGTGAAVEGNSTDNAGLFTTGSSGVTSCVVTFRFGFTGQTNTPRNPYCTVTPLAGGASPAITPAVGTLTVTTTTANAPYTWICR